MVVSVVYERGFVGVRQERKLHEGRYGREGLIVELKWMRGAGCGAEVGEREWLEVACVCVVGCGRVGERERLAVAWEVGMPKLGARVLVATGNG
ncbi:unnamed protein product [Dovyalis caffra]|uniref:Uncharacterized protein n=1 Tax=Dovyalis caffra TaxID=77055 RepID=A0AAV1QV47_9ROSI|nr:unnamed protein product [Dovyalis caffra]